MSKIPYLKKSHCLYPKLLKNIVPVPEKLYYQGNVNLLDSPSLAIVGSRAMTSYGEQVCEMITTDLVQLGFTIISGLATGIDAVAHRTALNLNGNTIAVVANGLDINSIFPIEHKLLSKKISDNGLLLSEYPPTTKARRYFFPARNRIIAGLSLGTIVIEAKEKSGALITARLAMENNREVFAVPGSINSNRSKGTHKLIKQGAKLIENTQDILEELNLSNIKINNPSFVYNNVSSLQKDIINAITNGVVYTDLLLKKINIKPTILNVNLTELEIKGIVRKNKDYTYSLIAK